MSAAASPEPHASELLTATQRRVVIAGMMGGVSLAAIDQMVLSTAVAAIAGELGDIGQAPWIFSANLLTSASSMPIWGKLGDLYGRRRVFQIAISLFIVASLVAATSDSMLQLIVCRALQGLGGGALLTMPYAILGDIVPPRDRAAYVGFISVVWTAAGFVGPPLGGFFVDGPGWRWMFTMNVPAALFALIALQTCYRIPVQRIEHRVDFEGALLLFGSVGTLILYTSWAGEALGWFSPGALAFLGASALLGVAFAFQERRAAEPILELSLLRRRTIWPPLLATCIFGFANFAIAFFLPLFGIVVRGANTVQAGFTLAPLTLGLLAAGIVTGRRAATTQRYRRYASIGLAIYIAGLAGLITSDATTPLVVFLGWSLLLGLGSGSLSPVVVSAIQNAVEERYLGVASSLPGFSRAVAQTIGTSVLGSFLAIRITRRLQADVAGVAPAGTDLDYFVDSPDAVRDLEGPLLEAVVEAYRAAFSDTFSVMLVVMALALVVSRFMRDPKLRTQT
ncbi:MAG: MFS transporter [bacterium]|nr:MFS transporter [bacterium]